MRERWNALLCYVCMSIFRGPVSLCPPQVWVRKASGAGNGWSYLRVGFCSGQHSRHNSSWSLSPPPARANRGFFLALHNEKLCFTWRWKPLEGWGLPKTTALKSFSGLCYFIMNLSKLSFKASYLLVSPAASLKVRRSWLQFSVLAWLSGTGAVAHPATSIL